MKIIEFVKNGLNNLKRNKMRYIILPILIILYTYWSYKAIDNLIDLYKNPYLDGTNAEDYTYGWLLTHLSILFGIILYFIIKYW